MTPEQIAAQDALQIAIENHARALHAPTAGDAVQITGDWILVSCVTLLDPADNERRYVYNLGFSGGEQPEHVAYGLLKTATTILQNGEANG